MKKLHMNHKTHLKWKNTFMLPWETKSLHMMSWVMNGLLIRNTYWNLALMITSKQNTENSFSKETRRTCYTALMKRLCSYKVLVTSRCLKRTTQSWSLKLLNAQKKVWKSYTAKMIQLSVKNLKLSISGWLTTKSVCIFMCLMTNLISNLMKKGIFVRMKFGYPQFHFNQTSFMIMDLDLERMNS